ncbi:hypothetical protein [Glaciimonas immobilis]|uniref:Resolvase/invertase-type recombinase catalytic domain-containing protein n=1 Tax=Glaciimonas immobilis TaxID=728004 RepID=A0A840RLR4_9BURK|nr:hypothetical protein [Glaciimonas immobilis]MBB5198703.1 hypothetical protein [Glaciimonas immobilis]
MSTFAYSRVSTKDQTTANQTFDIEKAGYKMDYWFADEGVSQPAAPVQSVARPDTRWGNAGGLEAGSLIGTTLLGTNQETIISGVMSAKSGNNYFTVIHLDPARLIMSLLAVGTMYKRGGKRFIVR